LQLDERLGSQTPRVSSYPQARTSAGQEAVDLAASAGLILDPWQQAVLLASLGELRGGRWATPEVGLVVPRRNGKGAVLEARELAGLFLFGEEIIHTAHEFKTSADHYRRMERLIKGTPDLDRKVADYYKAPGTESIVLRGGRTLRFIARTKNSGRGLEGDLLVLDEAFALADEHLDALNPTTSARPNAQIWYTSSPPLDGISGKPLFALRARGESRAPDLAWFDWGCDADVDADDVEAWYASNPALGYRITEAAVRRDRASMSTEGFRRERLGVWPRTASEPWLVIPKADWDRAADPTFGHPVAVAFAVTLSTEREWATIAAAGPDGNGRLLAHVAERRQGTGWVVERLRQLVERWQPVAVVIDKGSPAASLALEAEEAGIELTPIQARDVAAAAGAFYDGIAGRPAVDPETGEPGRDPRVLRHRDQPELTAAVAGAVKRKLSTTWAWDQLAASVDITPLIAVSNALWGYTTRTPEPADLEPLVAWR
jgi:hypothetical protein